MARQDLSPHHVQPHDARTTTASDRGRDVYLRRGSICEYPITSSSTLPNCRIRSSWRYSTLESGVAPLDSTLQFRRIQVCCNYQSWKLPLTISEQCSAATNHLITNAVFNISSDLIILSIPMPLLFKVRLPMKNKVVLVSKICCAIRG
jgi:hypothetical protein